MMVIMWWGFVGGIILIILTKYKGSGFKKNEIFWSIFYFGLSVLPLSTLLMTSYTGVSGGYSSFINLDQVSVCFVFLTVFITLLSVMSMLVGGSQENTYDYGSLMLLFFTLGFSLMGVFCLSSVVMFFIMFELCVIPIFLIISKWGSQKNRIFSSYYFLFYSIVTPAPLLLCLIKGLGLGNSFISGVFLFENISTLGIVGLTLGFLTKMPIYSLHIWLPKAHVDAPVSGSMVLAGVMLKMGAFSMLRFYEICFGGIGGGLSTVAGGVMIFMGVVGMVLCNSICLRVVDVKVILAFSSVAHMSVALSALMGSGSWGVLSSVYVFLGHSIISPAMFFIGSLVYSRSSTRLSISGTSMVGGGGFYLMMLFIWMMNFGFPPFMNFFSEVGIFYGIFSMSTYLGLLLFMGYFFAGVCMMNLLVNSNHSFTTKLLMMCNKKLFVKGEWWGGMMMVVSYIFMSIALLLA